MTATVMGLTSYEFHLFNEILEARFGLQFPESKKDILETRVRPRLEALHLRSFLEYYLVLQAEPDDEFTELAKLATNNETYFFRERHQFEALFHDAIPGLQADLAIPKTLRVLCAGSSSGEEAYTLGFYGKRHQDRCGLTMQVDAFDIDADRVAMAKRAVYRPRSVRDMSEDQIRRYLDRTTADHYEVARSFRTGIKFSRGNVVDLTSFQSPVPYDAVFCRNVLIYFSPLALQRAIENFARVLRPGGLLFLGYSESIIGLSDRFDTVRLDRCIAYRRVAQ